MNRLSYRHARDVRLCADYRIKPHAPPLVQSPSILLSFNLAAYCPGGIFNALANHWNFFFLHKTKFLFYPIVICSVYLWTTGVSNPDRYPYLHTSCQSLVARAFALEVLVISAHFTSTCRVPIPREILERSVAKVNRCSQSISFSPWSYHLLSYTPSHHE